jgi:5-methylcytosine-specific restriction endonuclease McrA
MARSTDSHLDPRREFHIAGEIGSRTPHKDRRLAREAAGMPPGRPRPPEPSEASVRALAEAYPARGKLHEYLLARFGCIPHWAAGYFTKQRADAVARKRPSRAEEKRGRRAGGRVTVARGAGPTPTLRALVYARDGHRCVICDSPDDLTLDHWIPRARGGKNTLENCRTMCRGCNHAKGDKMPAEFLVMDGAPGSRDRRMALLTGNAEARQSGPRISAAEAH